MVIRSMTLYLNTGHVFLSMAARCVIENQWTCVTQQTASVVLQCAWVSAPEVAVRIGRGTRTSPSNHEFINRFRSNCCNMYKYCSIYIVSSGSGLCAAISFLFSSLQTARKMQQMGLSCLSKRIGGSLAGPCQLIHTC